MANPEHLAKLRGDPSVWAAWRSDEPRIDPDLSSADLRGAFLVGANLVRANLGDANLRGARLCEANLSEANLIGVSGREALVETSPH